MILLLATDKKGAEKWSGKQAKISTACQRMIQNIGSKVYFLRWSHLTSFCRSTLFMQKLTFSWSVFGI